MSTVGPPEPADGPSPTLRTLHRVEVILREADAEDEGPLSLAEIERRMPARSVRHTTLRTCVDELVRLGLVTEDPERGAMWTLVEDPAFWTDRDTVQLS